MNQQPGISNTGHELQDAPQSATAFLSYDSLNDGMWMTGGGAALSEYDAMRTSDNTDEYD